MRVGVAVIGPEECADTKLAFRSFHLLDSLRSDSYDLAGTEVAEIIESGLLICKALHRNGISVLILTDQNRQTAIEIARGIDTLVGHNKNRHRSTDHLLSILNTFGNGVLLVNDRSNQFGGVDVAAAQFKEVMILVEYQLNEAFLIVDPADCTDGKIAEMAANQQRLRFVIGNTGNTQITAHIVYILFELCSEGRVLDIMDLTLETQLAVIHDHTAASRSQMGMIVDAVIKIVITLFL